MPSTVIPHNRKIWMYCVSVCEVEWSCVDIMDTLCFEGLVAEKV